MKIREKNINKEDGKRENISDKKKIKRKEGKKSRKHRKEMKK